MGLHIIVRDANGQEHVGWDECRMQGDREFASISHSLPKVGPPENRGWLEDAFRPEDFETWRAAIREEFPEPDRHLLLLDLLEADPTFWIYFSY